MSNRDDYLAKIAIIEAIPDDQMKSPNMPVDHYIQEAENLYQWCLPDKEKLTAASLDWIFVEDLPVRAGAAREAQSNWFIERFTRKEAEKEWNEKSPAAYDLRDTLLHHFRFAFRKDAGLLNRVSQIADGGGHADMIQDLNDLSLLGKDHTDMLEAISFDAALLDAAAATADEMAAILSLTTADRADNSRERITRDKAVTYLREAVDEIRNCGQYVFWRNEERFKGYVSHYFKSRRNKKTSAKDSISED
jgi:hypothetical protein